MPASVVESFVAQAHAAEAIGSPFTASLCRLLADRLDHSSRFGHKILEWPGDPTADALALRACGALHAIARSWKEPDLRDAYPPAPYDEKRMWTAIVGVLSRHDNYLARFLDNPPQTNEVARSALILGGALHAVAMTRLPLALYEIGASAGFNLGFDRYRYSLGGRNVWGPADSPLVISCEWRGTVPPLSAKVVVDSRQGCDLNPLDPKVEPDIERLMAYIWADQTHRLRRTAAAIRIAMEAGSKVEQADAGEWLDRELRRKPRSGVCRFVFHTVVWQYLPDATRLRLESTLEKAAAAATEESPLAYFSLETDNDPEGAIVGAPMTLTLWPSGTVLRLGRGDYHGRWAKWARLSR